MLKKKLHISTATVTFELDESTATICCIVINMRVKNETQCIVDSFLIPSEFNWQILRKVWQSHFENIKLNLFYARKNNPEIIEAICIHMKIIIIIIEICTICERRGLFHDRLSFIIIAGIVLNE